MRTRLLIALGILVAEALLTSVFLDGDQLMARGGWLPALLGRWGAWTVRFGLLFSVFFGGSFLVHKGYVQAAVPSGTPKRAWAIHAVTLASFAGLSYTLYWTTAYTALSNVLTILWIIAALGVAASAAAAVIPIRAWLPVLQETRPRLAVAGAAAGLSCWLGALSDRLWEPMRSVTFQLVQIVLHPIVPNLIVQPERFRIATGRFGVIIAPECSGLEGIGLLLIFGLLWTIAFWREVGIRKCLGLLGAGLIALYCLNVLRIASLVLIGHFGAPGIAKAGFHSQAGWIAFSSVALGMTLIARHLAEREPTSDDAELHNPAAPLVVPFLAAIAAGMIAGAASAGFEWLYGLRVLAAAIALWYYRHDLRSLCWKAPRSETFLAGVGVFAIWIILERALGGPIQFHRSMPPDLAAASPVSQSVWLIFRVAGAVLTVPLIEELAFRGYLLRRLQSPDFEQISLQQFPMLAVLGSSLIFGALHGNRWLAGTLAGVAYAWALSRRGVVSDAVAAHAITNALIAALVLLSGTWNLW